MVEKKVVKTAYATYLSNTDRRFYCACLLRHETRPPAADVRSGTCLDGLNHGEGSPVQNVLDSKLAMYKQPPPQANMGIIIKVQNTLIAEKKSLNISQREVPKSEMEKDTLNSDIKDYYQQSCSSAQGLVDGQSPLQSTVIRQYVG